MKKLLDRIFIDGLTGMAQGLFATLIIGTIIQQIGTYCGGNIGNLIFTLGKVAAGLTGSWALYLLGRTGGSRLLDWYFKKFPKHKPVIEEKIRFLREKGCVGVFVSKLLPMVRTLISIPAGMVKMNFVKYTVSSALGIFLWNFLFVGAGYFFGEAAIRIFS